MTHRMTFQDLPMSSETTGSFEPGWNPFELIDKAIEQQERTKVWPTWTDDDLKRIDEIGLDLKDFVDPFELSSIVDMSRDECVRIFDSLDQRLDGAMQQRNPTLIPTLVNSNQDKRETSTKRVQFESPPTKRPRTHYCKPRQHQQMRSFSAFYPNKENHVINFEPITFVYLKGFNFNRKKITWLII